jgi:hypothetical protein
MFLTGALTVLSVACVYLTLDYNKKLRDLGRTQMKIQEEVQNRRRAEALFMDLIEYSKSNPAIDPLLQGAGLKPGGAAPANR